VRLIPFSPTPTEKMYFAKIEGQDYWVKPIQLSEDLPAPLAGDMASEVEFVVSSLSRGLALEKIRNEDLEVREIQFQARLDECVEREAILREEKQQLAVRLYAEINARESSDAQIASLSHQLLMLTEQLKSKKIDVEKLFLATPPVQVSIAPQLPRFDAAVAESSSSFVPQILTSSSSQTPLVTLGSTSQATFSSSSEPSLLLDLMSPIQITSHSHGTLTSSSNQPHLMPSYAAIATSSAAAPSAPAPSAAPSNPAPSAIASSSSSNIGAPSLDPQQWLNNQDLDVSKRPHDAVLAAASRGIVPVLKWLHQQPGVSITKISPDGSNAVYAAASKSRLEALEYLLSLGADSKFSREDYAILSNLSHQAANRGFVKVLKWLVKKVDLSAVSSSGATLIHSAALGGQLEVIKWLITDRRLDLHGTRKDGYGAAHIAAQKGHLHLLQFLKQQGVDMRATTNGGLTPAQLAIVANQEDVVEWMKQNKLMQNT